MLGCQCVGTCKWTRADQSKDVPVLELEEV